MEKKLLLHRKNYPKRSRNAFTLIELLIVIMLIGFTLSGLGFQIPKWIKHETFEKSVARVQSKIALAQEIMVDYGTDVALIFDKGEEGIYCSLNPAPGLPEHLRKVINRDKILKGIDDVSIDEKMRYPLSLHFSASSYKTPQATLTLSGIRTSSLYLPGYPARITNTPPSRGRSMSDEPPYPKEI